MVWLLFQSRFDGSPCTAECVCGGAEFILCPSLPPYSVQARGREGRRLAVLWFKYSLLVFTEVLLPCQCRVLWKDGHDLLPPGTDLWK